MINDGQIYRFVCGKFHFEYLQLKDLGVQRHLYCLQVRSLLFIGVAPTAAYLQAARSLSTVLLGYAPGMVGVVTHCVDIDLSTTSASCQNSGMVCSENCIPMH